MDINFTPPKNNFSGIQISSNISKEEHPTIKSNIAVSNLKSFDVPKFSISAPKYETWGEVGQAWTQGWSEDGVSNIQNFLSLSQDSYNFMLTTNFGLNKLAKEGWENSKARKEMLEWGKLKLPKIEDPYKSLVGIPEGKTPGELYGDLWATHMKNTLSGMADSLMNSLVNGGLVTLGEVSKKIVTSFLGEGIISNISNMLNMGKGLFNAGKAFGESFKSIKDAGFLVPEAGLWNGFVTGEAKDNNANAKEGMKKADQALSNIENTLDAAISMLGGTNLLTTKRKNKVEEAASEKSSPEAEKDQKAIDKKLEAISSASTSPITATRTTQKNNTIKIKATEDDSTSGPLDIKSTSLKEDTSIDGFISKILLSKDVMSNMYEVVFTFDDDRINFQNENIDPFVVSARVSAISIPGEEQVAFPTKFCGSNISRLDNQINYSHQSSFEFIADDPLYYIQYFNKLAQVDTFINNKWCKLTLDTLKTVLKENSVNISLAELPVVLSKKKINLYVRRGINKESFRVWKFSNIRILGPGSGIGFKRESSSTVNFSYEFIFSNCTEVSLEESSNVFNKKSSTGGN